MAEVRKHFIYLAVLATVLGIVGLFIMQQNMSGKVVLNSADVINADEMLKHSSQGDCWVSINNVVYDATFAIANYVEFRDLAGNCGASADSFAKTLKPETLKFLDVHRLGILA